MMILGAAASLAAAEQAVAGRQLLAGTLALPVDSPEGLGSSLCRGMAWVLCMRMQVRLLS